MSDEVIELKEIPALYAKVKCQFNSGVSKSRRAVYFGEVTCNGKVIREDGYMLIQNEPNTKYVQAPKTSKKK